MGDLTKNFSRWEFEKNGCKTPDSLLPNLRRLAREMQKVRDAIGKPVHITRNGGYRTEEVNRRIGGAPNSQHKLATACDFTVEGMAPDRATDRVFELRRDGGISKGGIGRYTGFTHYDCRGANANWKGTGVK
ncbi:MAG: hypothetical protein KJ556_21365 [Gammaproteobacteria bacterium]|nr:hypothetical protein [Gammaproteobacteria bacterium]